MGGHRAGAIAVAISALTLASCEAERRIWIEPAWPADREVVLVATDPGGKNLGPWHLLPGEVIDGRSLPDGSTLIAATYQTGAGMPLDLRRCGVTLGGGGHNLPPPVDTWVAGPITPDLERPQFSRATAEVDVDLRFNDLECGKTVCESLALEMQEVHALPGFHIRAGAFLSPSEVIFAGHYDQEWFPEKEHRSEVFRLSRGGMPTSLGTIGTFVTADTLATDRRGTAWVGTGRGLYRVDLATRSVSPMGFAGGERFLRVAGRSDGLVIGVDPGRSVFELVGSSTGPVARPDFPQAVWSIALADDGRAAALGPQTIHRASDGAWSEEETPLPLNPASLIALGHGELLLLTPDSVSTDITSRALYRAGPGADWSTVFDRGTSLELRSVAAVGDAFLFGGVDGVTGFLRALDGSETCSVNEQQGLPLLSSVAAIAWWSEQEVGAVFTQSLGPASPPRIIWFTRR